MIFKRGCCYISSSIVVILYTTAATHLFLFLHNNRQTSWWSITLMVVVGYGMWQALIWPTELRRQLESPAHQQQQGGGPNH